MHGHIQENKHQFVYHLPGVVPTHRQVRIFQKLLPVRCTEIDIYSYLLRRVIVEGSSKHAPNHALHQQRTYGKNQTLLSATKRHKQRTTMVTLPESGI